MQNTTSSGRQTNWQSEEEDSEQGSIDEPSQSTPRREGEIGPQAGIVLGKWQLVGLLVAVAVVAAAATSAVILIDRYDVPGRLLKQVQETQRLLAETAPSLEASVEVKPTMERARLVGNTDGQGVYIRRTPRLEDSIKAWPDGTAMAVVGEDREVEGVTWSNVRDPEGNMGWVPTEYLIPSPTGTPK